MFLNRIREWLLGPRQEILLAHRYEAARCPDPACVGSLQWIPEAPGSGEGKHCGRCHGIFTATYHVAGTRRFSFFKNASMIALNDGFEKIISRRSDIRCACSMKISPIDIGE